MQKLLPTEGFELRSQGSCTNPTLQDSTQRKMGSLVSKGQQYQFGLREREIKDSNSVVAEGIKKFQQMAGNSQEMNALLSSSQPSCPEHVMLDYLGFGFSPQNHMPSQGMLN